MRMTGHFDSVLLSDGNDAFDEITVRMHLDQVVQNRIVMAFEYLRMSDGQEELVARGRHEVACMRRQGDKTVPTLVPDSLREALQMYSRR